MNDEIKYALIFLSGAAVGAAVSFGILKKKYEQIAQEEIDSVKEMYAKKKKEMQEAEKRYEKGVEAFKSYATVYNEQKEALKNEEEIDEEEEYDDDEYFIVEDSSMLKEEGDENKMNSRKPYVIPPEDFGEGEFGDYDYDTVSLTLYADGVIENEFGDVLSDDEIDDYIGKDSLNHFGEYEDDSVFVRNEGLRTDYEILKSNLVHEE